MVRGLFETHLLVSSLKASIDFYQKVLGLKLCHVEEERRIAFFWIGKPKQAMLGLWETAGGKIEKRHFALRCSANDVINKAITFLKQRGLKPRNFFNNGVDQPLVFSWIPAVAIYFDDPDGNEVEFIGVLQGQGRSDLGVVTYEQWLMRSEQL